MVREPRLAADVDARTRRERILDSFELCTRLQQLSCASAFVYADDAGTPVLVVGGFGQKSNADLGAPALSCRSHVVERLMWRSLRDMQISHLKQRPDHSKHPRSTATVVVRRL